MIFISLFIRITTLIFLIVWLVFWNIEAKKSELKKRKLQQVPMIRYARRLYVGVPYLLIFVQLAGMQILSFNTMSLQVIGFCLVLAGIGVSVLSRLELGANWTGAYEYQIKHDHSLITTGVYSYIRHPIYTGLIMIFTGAELAAQSYLAFVICLYLFIWAYFQAKAEEKLLLSHFGQKYAKYQADSNMLVPYII